MPPTFFSFCEGPGERVPLLIRHYFHTNCLHPSAHTDCLRSKDGTSYTGTMHRTKSGIQCVTWHDWLHQNAESTPNTPLTRNMADDTINKNYCRNLDPLDMPDGPWCYYNAGGSLLRRGYCKLPICGKHVIFTILQYFGNQPFFHQIRAGK